MFTWPALRVDLLRHPLLSRRAGVPKAVEPHYDVVVMQTAQVPISTKESWCPGCQADTCVTDPEGLVCGRVHQTLHGELLSTTKYIQ